LSIYNAFSALFARRLWFARSVRFLHVAGGLPGQFDFVAVHISALGLAVGAVNYVAVREVPGTVALGLVVAELAFEVGAVGVNPFSRDNHAVLELSYILLARFVEHVGALALFLTVNPVA